MQFPSQCKNRTDRCGSTNYLVPCSAVLGEQYKFSRAQKCNFLVSAKTAPTGTDQQTTPCLAAPYWARNRNFQNFGATYRNGTVLAPMHCLYCKETMGVERS